LIVIFEMLAQRRTVRKYFITLWGGELLAMHLKFMVNPISPRKKQLGSILAVLERADVGPKSSKNVAPRT
jgi:hypothetical protein